MMATVLKIPLHKTIDGEFGASLGAARLGLIAAEKCPPLPVCSPPPIDTTIDPHTEFEAELDHHYARFNKLYASLKPVFADRQG